MILFHALNALVIKSTCVYPYVAKTSHEPNQIRLPSYLPNRFDLSCVLRLSLCATGMLMVQWVTVVFAYLFTWHALYVLRGEHQAFAEMREVGALFFVCVTAVFARLTRERTE